MLPSAVRTLQRRGAPARGPRSVWRHVVRGREPSCRDWHSYGTRRGTNPVSCVSCSQVRVDFRGRWHVALYSSTSQRTNEFIAAYLFGLELRDPSDALIGWPWSCPGGRRFGRVAAGVAGIANRPRAGSGSGLTACTIVAVSSLADQPCRSTRAGPRRTSPRAGVHPATIVTTSELVYAASMKVHHVTRQRTPTATTRSPRLPDRLASKRSPHPQADQDTRMRQHHCHDSDGRRAMRHADRDLAAATDYCVRRHPIQTERREQECQDTEESGEQR